MSNPYDEPYISFITTPLHLSPIASSRPGATVCGEQTPPYGTIPFREASEEPRLCVPLESPVDRRCPKCWAVWRALKEDGVDLSVRSTVPL